MLQQYHRWQRQQRNTRCWPVLARILAGGLVSLSLLLLFSGVYQISYNSLVNNLELAFKLVFVATGSIGLITSTVMPGKLLVQRHWFNMALAALSLIASFFLILKYGFRPLNLYRLILASTAVASYLLCLINLACLILLRRMRNQPQNQPQPQPQLHSEGYQHPHLHPHSPSMVGFPHGFTAAPPYLPESLLLQHIPPTPLPPPLPPPQLPPLLFLPPPYSPGAKPPDYDHLDV